VDTWGNTLNKCQHKQSAYIIDRREYRGQEWTSFVCDSCGRVCLAYKDGLEQRQVVNSESPKEITAYVMPDSTIPKVE